MNASFSILQKLKGQFLQSVANKADFQVAFAPFAFTMSNDDFFFLKGHSGTGEEARRMLREKSEFALLANSVLTKPNIWRVDSQNLLQDAYQSVLQSGQVVDPDVLSTEEQGRLKLAKAVLFTAAGKPSAKYKSYKKYEIKLTDAEKALLDHQIVRSTIEAADATATATWNARLQTLNSQKRDLLIEWQANGHKGAVEAAKGAYDEIVFGKAEFITKWRDAKNFLSGPPHLLTDEFGVEFLSTTCIPNAIADPAAPIWKKVSLPKPEIATLVQSFLQDVPGDVLAAFGDTGLELDAISFEYCMLDILRPWFDETVINNRLWKFADPALSVSSGDGNLTGSIPAYPIKLILAKNIDLVFAPNSPVNEDIKNQLRNGNRLFFGPLLLKTIPANLADDKITGFRVQQVSKLELAVLANVAVRKPGILMPQRIDKPVQALEVWNREPQMLMRKNLEMSSLRVLQSRAAATRSAPMPRPAFAGMPMTAMIRAELHTAPMTLANRPISGTFAAPPLQVQLGLIMPMPPRPISTPFAAPVAPPAITPAAPAPQPAAPAPVPVAAPAQPVTVSGRVLSSSNQPLPTAEVQLLNMATAATQSVLSLDDGSYTLGQLESGSYQLKARKSGYSTLERTIEVRGHSTQDLLLQAQTVPVDTFQVIGVICKKLPRLPNPMPGASYV